MKRFRHLPSSTDAWLALVLGTLITAGFVYMSFTNQEFFGGADEMYHYWWARYAWQHPQLFLDLWGKPLYTALSSPMAQFGFIGSRIFNVLVYALTSFLAYRILKQLRISQAWVYIPLLAACPVYFMASSSVLTEPLFGLVLVLFLYLYLGGHVTTAAILVSFLPFARNEGLFLLPVIAVFFAVQRYYRGIALLLSGTLVMTLIGWIMFGDMLWLVHQNPYTGKEAYGSGQLFHYIIDIKHTVGILPAILAVAGWAFILARILRNRERRDWALITFLYMTSLLYLAYLTMHSVVWYLGLGVSLGLIRVMAAIYPLAALAAAYFLGYFAGRIRPGFLGVLVSVAVLIPAVMSPLRMYKPPVKETEMQAIGTGVADFIENQYPDSVHVVCLDPRIIFRLGRGPFDPAATRLQVDNTMTPSAEMDPGTLYIWESHFSGVEKGIDKATILADTGFAMVREFGREKGFVVFNDVPYEIIVFERKGE